MLSLRSLALALALSLGVVACAPPRAVTAVQEGHIALGKSRDDVLGAAGPPELVLASEGAETFYYRRGDQAVSVTFVAGKVVAFSDADPWPAEAARATDDASEPVSDGRIRVGMSEQEVRILLGDPDGLTAKDGQETLHWLTGDEVDSVVHLKDGKVVGFWDRPVSEFTQNLPTSDRDVATTSGKIRVGMTTAEVTRLLGEPDGRSGREGVTVHRYESDPVFGDEIVFSVGFANDRVVDLFLFNVTRDEELKEEEEARREAAAAEAQGKEAEGSILGFLGNELVRAALVTAAAGAQGNVSSQSDQSSATRTLELNGQRFQGSGPDFGRPCSPDDPCPDGYRCHLVAGEVGSCVE